MTPLKHLGIIMDGNGRWASLRGRDRFWGHLRGAKVAQKIIEECSALKLEALTLFAFSTENWLRPSEEVTFLMHLLRRQLSRERHKLVANNIRFKVIGDLTRLPDFTRDSVLETMEATKNSTGMILTFALSYGSRQEITRACKDIAQKVLEGALSVQDISEDLVSGHLQTADLPDPDLIIRTSGEYRLSNFLLWQAAYSEILIRETLWPDFSVNELHECLRSYQLRTRRFGRVLEHAPQDMDSPLVIAP